MGLKTIIENARTSNATALDLNEQGLKHLPAELCELLSCCLQPLINILTGFYSEVEVESLTRLNLAHNRLTDVSENIVRLKNLEMLSVFGNKLGELPKTINGIRTLKVLTASHNFIYELPQGFGSCPSLVFLDMSCNQLKELSPNFGFLTTLRSLHLSDNHLETLPAEIGKLTQLATLVLCNNDLTSLPDEIGNLQSLKYCLLQGNKLKSLPKSFATIPLGSEGSVLKLYKNPWYPFLADTLEDNSVQGFLDAMKSDSYEDKVKEAEAKGNIEPTLNSGRWTWKSSVFVNDDTTFQSQPHSDLFLFTFTGHEQTHVGIRSLMGVTGLASYVQQLQPSPGEPLKWQLGPASVDKEDASQVVFVDGNSYAHHVAKEISLVQGAKVLGKHVDIFKRAGFCLTFVFDGVLPVHKIDERIGRDTEKISRISTVMAEVVKRRALGATSAPSSPVAATLLPPLAIPALMNELREMDIPIIVPQGEADVALAQMARTESAPVISLDSDFFVHLLEDPEHHLHEDVSSSSLPLLGYIPLNTLRVNEDVLYGQLFRRPIVAESLGVCPNLLPALAALVGCDYTSRRDRASATQEILGAKKGHARIKHVVKLLSDLNDLVNPLAAIDMLISRHVSDGSAIELGAELKFAVTQYIGQNEKTHPIPPAASATITMLYRTGGFNHKLVEVATQRIFWCSPFLEDIGRAAAWEVARPLRRWAYALISWSTEQGREKQPDSRSLWEALPVDEQLWVDYVRGDLLVKEYLRRGERLVAENVKPVAWEELKGLSVSVTGNDSKHNLLNLSDSAREAMHLRILKSDTDKIRSLPVGIRPLAISVRSMISELFARGQPLANYELVALVSAGLVSYLRAQPESSLPKPTNMATGSASTPLTLHRLAQMEVFLFSSLIIAQSLLHPLIHQHDFLTGHWTCLDGQEFHRCIELAKGGAEHVRLLCGDGHEQADEHRLGLYRQVFEAVVEGLEESVERVMSYGGGSGKKKKKRIKTKGIEKTVGQGSLRASSNLFDVLSSGRSF
ncbi:hypothetical protein SpCBS45565_g07565 [Spizellomyces sp. 'palustris']|nr:hypothetical protein SpCBS45565_g07565 [Spizellomyces sp. 'palustris']